MDSIACIILFVKVEYAFKAFIHNHVCPSISRAKVVAAATMSFLQILLFDKNFLCPENGRAKKIYRP